MSMGATVADEVIPDPIVHITMVLDRSGSMQMTRDDVIGGFNAFLEEQQAQPGECRLTMIQFDSGGVDHLHVATPIRGVRPMTEKDFVPRGGTPLYDAIGQAIGEAEARIIAKTVVEVQLFVIITDGKDNDSNRYTKRQISTMIEEKQGKGWVFTFMGANFDAYAVGESLGIKAKNVSSFAANVDGTAAAYASVSSNTVGLRSAVLQGATGQSVNDAGFYSFAGKGAEAFTIQQGSTTSVHPGINWTEQPPIDPDVVAGITVEVQPPEDDEPPA